MSIIVTGIQTTFGDIAARRLPDAILQQLKRIQVGANIADTIAYEIIGVVSPFPEEEIPPSERFFNTFYPIVGGVVLDPESLSLEALNSATTRALAVARRSINNTMYQFSACFLLNSPTLRIDVIVTTPVPDSTAREEDHYMITFRGESANGAEDAGVYQIAQYLHTYETVTRTQAGEEVREAIEPAEGSAEVLAPGAGDALSLLGVEGTLSELLDEAAYGLGAPSEDSDAAMS